jgi:hypothetical protein
MQANLAANNLQVKAMLDDRKIDSLFHILLKVINRTLR